MGQGSNTLHEPDEKLSADIIDRHRAIQSLMEELEAVDWYDQRVAACTNDELRAILAHNRDEEKEHAAMVLEWLRRNDAKFEEHLKDYLFTDGPIVGREAAAKAAANGGGASGGGNGTKGASAGSLGVGSLRGPGAK